MESEMATRSARRPRIAWSGPTIAMRGGGTISFGDDANGKRNKARHHGNIDKELP